MTHIGRQILLDKSEPDLITLVKNSGFTHVLFDFFPVGAVWPDPNLYLFSSPAFIAAHMHLVYASNYIYLYQITLDTPPNQSSTANILQDPQFHNALGQQPPVWIPFGTQLTPPPTANCSGAYVNNRGGFIQAFRARTDELYSLRFKMRGYAPGTFGKIQANWQSDDNVQTGYSLEVKTVTETLDTYEIGSTVPIGTTKGVLFVSGFSDAPICVESVEAVRQQ